MATEIVKLKPPVLELNFDEIKGELVAELDKYQNVVVTPETCAADKKLAQEISARGKEFNRLRIDKVKEISAPIKLFEDQMKELTSLCNQVADSIKTQVKTFEDERLADISRKLIAEMFSVRERFKIEPEFRVETIDHLIKLTAVTAKGALKKATISELERIAQNELARQQVTENRLLQLESESYKAGLTTPLVRLNVEPFLFLDKESYEANLLALIESELKRQEQAEIRKQEQEERKARAKAIAEQRKQEQESHAEVKETADIDERPVPEATFSQEPMPEDEPVDYDQYAEQMAQEQESHQQEDRIKVKDGHVLCYATAVFKISVPNQVTEQMIENKLISMLESAGISSLDSIKVEKHA